MLNLTSRGGEVLSIDASTAKLAYAPCRFGTEVWSRGECNSAS
jgi:hypothetical protein